VLTVGVTFHGGTLRTVGDLDFMKPLFVGVFLFVSCDLALAQAVPLPRAKPQLSGATGPPLSQVLPLHDAHVWPSNCALRLVEIARFTHQPTVNGPSQCGAGDLVRLEGIMSSSRLISVRPAAILRCPMAEAVAQWVRADLDPILGELESPPVAITNGGSYDCRGRNNDSRAKISEHGRGNALDLGPIRLANGATVDLSNRFASQSIRQRLRDTACHRFTTVLGPGSDPFHADHIHVDLAERARGYRICQWEVGSPESTTEVPMPRPKPVALKEGKSTTGMSKSRDALAPGRQRKR
jgi:hypothetical protein